MAEQLRGNTREHPARRGSGRGPDRPFSVADGLVLVAAAAAGLALVRGWGSPRWCSPWILAAGQTVGPARRALQAAEVAVSWTIPFAMALTVALVAVRLRAPRPPLRRLARQPGPAACLAALGAIAARLAQEVLCWGIGYLTRPQSLVQLPSPPFVRYDNPGFHPPAWLWLRNALLEVFPIFVSPSVAVAVAAAWGVLLAGGLWRPATGWIDRSGRWLGRYWIGLGVVLAVFLEVGKFLN